MREGHGDDAYKYDHITSNFSSNVCDGVDHRGLQAYLSQRMDTLCHYPEPEPYTLERDLAQRLGLEPDEVCVTNGATEAIYLVAHAYAESTSAVWMPTFSEYADACRLHYHRVVSFYQLDSLPTEARLAWICNPNNPTGEVRPREALMDCIARRPNTLFVIDQSYEDFVQKPVLTAREAARCPNVLLIHSFTKHYSIPGLRLGYLTGDATLLRDIRLKRMPWSVNQLAIEAGGYLLRHDVEYTTDLTALLAEKDRVAHRLTALGCLEVWPSDTHYMLVRLRMGRAAALKDYLATTHGILIRDASNFEGLDEHFFRIAVQTPAQNDALIQAIESWIVSI